MNFIILSEQKSFIKASGSAPQVDGQEKAFLAAGKERISIRYKNIILKNIDRILDKFHLPLISDPFTNKTESDSVYLFIAVNQVYVKSNFHLLKNLKKHGNKLAFYMYDVWEPDFEEWKSYFDDLGVDYLFFAYKDSTEYFSRLGYSAYWVPVSADYTIFKSTKEKKTRLFMQMGRRNDDIHEKMLGYLKNHNIEDVRDNYVYRKSKTEEIFPNLQELAKEVSRTKYFVCVPKIYENYKRTGNVNDFICRYFESMSSGSLPIGKKPKTYDEFFPYEAMIELNDDYSDLEEKVTYFENHPEEYEELIAKNCQFVNENHSWGNRLKMMYDAIDNNHQSDIIVKK